MTHPFRALLVGLGLVLVVAGCGSAPASHGSTVATAPASAAATSAPTPAPTVAASYPSCASVWVGGRKLPNRYAGCTQAGAAVLAHAMYCESGQHLVVFRNRFFAVPGGKIFASQDARHDPRYHQILALCHG